MRKYDKSLLEVWEWKEKVYNDVKDLSPKEYLEKLKDDADKILSDGQIRLQTFTLKEKKKKVA